MLMPPTAARFSRIVDLITTVTLTRRPSNPVRRLNYVVDRSLTTFRPLCVMGIGLTVRLYALTDGQRENIMPPPIQFEVFAIHQLP